MAITFFPPPPPSAKARHRAMAPPAVPSSASSSSPFAPTRHASDGPLKTLSSSSSRSFKDRLVFKKKTPLMASNQTRITSGYATPTTSSPGRENVDLSQLPGRALDKPAKPFQLPNQQPSPPRSSSSSASYNTFLAPPSKTNTTKTLLANPRADLLSAPSSSSHTSHANVTSAPAPALTLILPPLAQSSPLILGRRLNHPTRLSSTPAFAATHLQLGPAISSSAGAPSGGLTHVALPRHALHASRLHCIVEPLFAVHPGLVRVSVLGQNGMKVMGKRVKVGETVIVDAGMGGEVRSEGDDGVVLRPGRPQGNASGLRLDFWGVKVLMPWGEGAVAPEEDDEIDVGAMEMDATDLEPEHASRREDRSSSPLTEDEDAHMDADIHQDDQEDDDDEDLEPSSSRPNSEAGDLIDARRQTFSSLPPSSPPPLDFLAHRSSSPDLSLALFPSSPPRASLVHPATAPIVAAPHPSTPPPTQHLPLAPSSPAESHHSYTFSLPPSPPSTSSASFDHTVVTGPIPATYDLPSLMSSTLVFSHQTSMSLPDLVRAVLETQPGMREEGTEEMWRGWCAGVLWGEIEREGMFGRIERKGKDASGQPLLDLFFYDPARDPDQVRAKDLGGLMRPLRGTQRQGKTYFFKRPSTPGKKRK